MGFMDFVSVLCAGFAVAVPDTVEMITISHKSEKLMKDMIKNGKNANTLAAEGFNEQAEYFMSRANEKRRELRELADRFDALGGCIGQLPLNAEKLPRENFRLPTRGE